MILEEFPNDTPAIDGAVVPVGVKVLADAETPVSVLARFDRREKNLFLLESAEGGERRGRYSFLGLDARLTATVFREKAARVMHGKVSEVACDGEGVFKGLGARPFKAMRYHSLCIDPATLPDCLAVTATAEDGCIMGVRHKELPVHGVQFHPESIMTPSGKRMLRNFLRMCEPA